MDAGTKVEIMEQGQWVGPFTVTGRAGRTPDHLVLMGPSGPFELYADAPFNVRPVEQVAAPAEDPAKSGECQETTPMDGVLGAVIDCRRPQGHPGEHYGSGVRWGGQRPSREEFGPWEVAKYESNSSTGRNYLVTRRLKSAPRVIRIHRASTGAPIWYTLAGAGHKAAQLNKDLDS